MPNTLKIPATWALLDVGRMQEIVKHKDDGIKVVAAASGVSVEEVKKLSQKAFDAALAAVSFLLRSKSEVFHKRFKLEGVEYGFIPDWSELTAGEFADLDEFLKGGSAENAHLILSVLYRPITRIRGDTYEIESYTGVNNAQKMKKIRADVFSGAMVFFCMAEQKLTKNFHRYLVRAAGLQVLRATTGGITHSMSQQERTQQK